MKQRLVLGIATLIGILVSGGVWTTIVTAPASAMEQMAESIRKTRSYRVSVISEAEYVSEPGKLPIIERTTATMCALADGSVRVEYSTPERRLDKAASSERPAQEEPEIGLIAIRSADRDSILINPDAKRYRRGTARRVPPPAMTIAALGGFSGQAKRELGTKQIHGKTSHGFVVDCESITGWGSGEAQIWIDTESKLPVEIKIERGSDFTREKMTIGDIRETLRLKGFQWNVDFAPTLFATTPPAEYTEESSRSIPGPRGLH